MKSSSLKWGHFIPTSNSNHENEEVIAFPHSTKHFLADRSADCDVMKSTGTCVPNRKLLSADRPGCCCSLGLLLLSRWFLLSCPGGERTWADPQDADRPAHLGRICGSRLRLDVRRRRASLAGSAAQRRRRAESTARSASFLGSSGLRYWFWSWIGSIESPRAHVDRLTAAAAGGGRGGLAGGLTLVGSDRPPRLEEEQPLWGGVAGPHPGSGCVGEVCAAARPGLKLPGSEAAGPGPPV